MAKIPNSNCLVGMRCPSCKQQDRFHIIASSIFEMVDDGSEGHGDIEYDEDAFCRCPNCDWEGTIADTRVLTKEEKERLIEAVMEDCFNAHDVLRNVVSAYVDATHDVESYAEYFRDIDEEDDDD